MRSVIAWTVLGLIIERPSYGWELWTRFERLYGGVLTARGSSIYSALDALADRGLIEETRVGVAESSELRQSKPYYRATKKGLEAYEAWMIAQMREHHLRSREFARQLGAFAQQPHVALEILDRVERAALDDKSGAIPTEKEFPTHVVPALGDRLASFSGRSVVAATLGWIEYARREFGELADRQRR